MVLILQPSEMVPTAPAFRLFLGVTLAQVLKLSAKLGEGRKHIVLYEILPSQENLKNNTTQSQWHSGCTKAAPGLNSLYMQWLVLQIATELQEQRGTRLRHSLLREQRGTRRQHSLKDLIQSSGVGRTRRVIRACSGGARPDHVSTLTPHAGVYDC